MHELTLHQSLQEAKVSFTQYKWTRIYHYWMQGENMTSTKQMIYLNKLSHSKPCINK
jgi:hypothetical protein